MIAGAEETFEEPQTGNSGEKGPRNVRQAAVGSDGIYDCQKDQCRNRDNKDILCGCRHERKMIAIFELLLTRIEKCFAKRGG